MVDYLAKSIRIKSITEPLNSGTIRYYSVMNDGSSSSKTMDEKELFLMKTARTGLVFNIIYLLSSCFAPLWLSLNPAIQKKEKIV